MWFVDFLHCRSRIFRPPQYSFFPLLQYWSFGTEPGIIIYLASQESRGGVEVNSEQASFTYQICQSANWLVWDKRGLVAWGSFDLILVFLLFLHTFQCFSDLQKESNKKVVFALPILRPTIRLYCSVHREKKLALLSHIHSCNPHPSKALPSSFYCSLQLYNVHAIIFIDIYMVLKKSRWNYTKSTIRLVNKKVNGVL
jgi:hypothetical protein